MRPEWHIARPGDCHDGNPDVNPDGVEVCDDGLDNDCDVHTADLLDDDFDGRTCDTDCDDGNSAIWHSPGTVPGLRFSINPQVILWDPPVETGAFSIRYELLRSSSALDFVSKIFCKTTNFESTNDPELPPEGTVWYYLARATNGCVEPGSLGEDSAGSPRLGSCP